MWPPCNENDYCMLHAIIAGYPFNVIIFCPFIVLVLLLTHSLSFVAEVCVETRAVGTAEGWKDTKSGFAFDLSDKRMRHYISMTRKNDGGGGVYSVPRMLAKRQDLQCMDKGY